MHEYREVQIKQRSVNQVTAMGTPELWRPPSADHPRMTSPNYHYNYIFTLGGAAR